LQTLFQREKIDHPALIATGRAGGMLRRPALCAATLALLAVLPAAQATIAVLPATLPTARYGTSAFWADGAAYVVGGRSAEAAPQSGHVLHTDIVRYDPATGESRVAGSLPTARFGTSVAWDGRSAYIFGGHGETALLDQIVRFDPATNRATTMNATLPLPVEGSSAVSDGRYAYVFGAGPGRARPTASCATTPPPTRPY
jgi:N-acetylneuraminic acid mutarotase